MIPLGALVTVVALLVAGVFVIDAGRDDVIADGVRIGTMDVGGMQRDEARRVVQRRLARAVGEPVTVIYGGRRFVLDAEDARARVDADATVDAALRRSRTGNAFGRVLGGNDARGTVAPRIAFSRPAVEDFAERVARRVDRPARDADIEWRDGKLDRTRARNGVRTRRPQLIAALVARIAKPSAERTVKLPVTVTERPDRNLDDLARRYPTVIAVDRDSKQLRLYRNLQLEHRYRIAVGKAGAETAAGRYKIVEKIVDPPWHAPEEEWAGELAGMTIPPGDPRNPLEARWMGFHDGQGIHGTDDVESLGTAASRGCLRMSVADVKELYRQVKVGTPIFLQ
jgi:lipoprotein-anchoring transpeptidase ErfK/SrfK